jgi:hypothetical protein
MKILNAISRKERHMDAAILKRARSVRPGVLASETIEGNLVEAAEFQELLVSHRRMVRVDRRAQRLRGLQDLDTGEVFLIDERRLLELRN